VNDHGIRLPVHFLLGSALHVHFEAIWNISFVGVSSPCRGFSRADGNPLPEMGQRLELVADIRQERIRVGRSRSAIAL
jgi:hypothetical protein